MADSIDFQYPYRLFYILRLNLLGSLASFINHQKIKNLFVMVLSTDAIASISFWMAFFI